MYIGIDSLISTHDNPPSFSCLWCRQRDDCNIHKNNTTFHCEVQRWTKVAICDSIGYFIRTLIDKTESSSIALDAHSTISSTTTVRLTNEEMDITLYHPSSMQVTATAIKTYAAVR